MLLLDLWAILNICTRFIHRATYSMPTSIIYRQWTVTLYVSQLSFRYFNQLQFLHSDWTRDVSNDVIKRKALYPYFNTHTLKRLNLSEFLICFNLVLGGHIVPFCCIVRFHLRTGIQCNCTLFMSVLYSVRRDTGRRPASVWLYTDLSSYHSW